MTYAVEPGFSNQKLLECLLKQFLNLVNRGGGSICIANQFPAGAYAAGPEMVLGEPAQ